MLKRYSLLSKKRGEVFFSTALQRDKDNFDLIPANRVQTGSEAERLAADFFNRGYRCNGLTSPYRQSGHGSPLPPCFSPAALQNLCRRQMKPCRRSFSRPSATPALRMSATFIEPPFAGSFQPALCPARSCFCGFQTKPLLAASQDKQTSRITTRSRLSRDSSATV